MTAHLYEVHAKGADAIEVLVDLRRLLAKLETKIEDGTANAGLASLEIYFINGEETHVEAGLDGSLCFEDRALSAEVVAAFKRSVKRSIAETEDWCRSLGVDPAGART